MAYRVMLRRLCSTTRPIVRPTMDSDEHKKFQLLSSKWWSSTGEFEALRTMNRLRVPLVRDGLLQATPEKIGSPLPLQDQVILDIGCGGGLLTEPLARLGATIIGVDTVRENIETAQHHLSLQEDINGKVKYINCNAEDLISTEEGRFDAVIASEVIEHVSEWENFLQNCVRLLRPGGSLFLTTINQTQLSYWTAVVGAEQIMRIVPKGTHEWEKFIPLQDLQFVLDKNKMHVMLVHGMCLNPLTLRWSWTSNTSVNYALHAIKSEDNREENN